MMDEETVWALLPHVSGRPNDATRLREIVLTMHGLTDETRERLLRKLVADEGRDDERH